MGSLLSHHDSVAVPAAAYPPASAGQSGTNSSGPADSQWNHAEGTAAPSHFWRNTILILLTLGVLGAMLKFTLAPSATSPGAPSAKKHYEL